MVRTIISLPESDKNWLSHEAQKNHTTMTAIIRIAVKHYRQESEHVTKPTSFKTLLKKTAGIWTSGDGLAFQKKLRSEWEKK